MTETTPAAGGAMGAAHERGGDDGMNPFRLDGRVAIVTGGGGGLGVGER